MIVQAFNLHKEHERAISSSQTNAPITASLKSSLISKLWFVIVLVIVFSPNLALSKQSFSDKQNLLLAELSTTWEEINSDGLAWDRKFYQSLIADSDPNIKLIGFSEKVTELNRSGDKNGLIDIAHEINDILNNETLSNKSLATIDSICSAPNIRKYSGQTHIVFRVIQLFFIKTK